MPKHGFRFSVRVREAVRSHVADAVALVDPTRYRQEPTYVVALVTRLEGIAYQGPNGLVVFRSTVYDDRGRGSTESLFGADFAITAAISDGMQHVDKAILFQAKLGTIEELTTDESDLLRRQLRKMKRVAPAPKILEIPQQDGRRAPRVLSGNQVLAGNETIREDLPDYFVRRVLTTLDGKTGRRYVSQVEDSRLTRLRVIAEVERAGARG